MEDVLIQRQCIGCDWCGRPGPQKNCSRCKSYYYCSRDCQVAHWKKHKPLCTRLKEERETFEEERQKEIQCAEEADDDEKVYGPCVICLEDSIELPISLDCGHDFCVKCLIESNITAAVDAGRGGGTCPICRADIPSITNPALERQQAYVRRAKMAKTEEEREKYASLALRYQEAVTKPHFDEQIYKDATELGWLFCRALEMNKMGMHAGVIHTVDEFFSLCSTTEYDEIDEEWVIELRILKAQGLVELKEWKEALEISKKLLREVQHHPIHGSKYGASILTSMSQAHYGLGNYREAQLEGCRSAKMKRQNPGIHRRIALAQKMTGDIEGAKISITRGILHEEQWNHENLEKNKEVLKELYNISKGSGVCIEHDSIKMIQAQLRK